MMHYRALRLVDHAKAKLIVVPTDEVGGLIASGAVSIDGRIGKIDDEVATSSTVTDDPTALARCAIIAPECYELSIRHEDDDLLIAIKPAGMHVHPLGPHRTGTLLNALLWHAGARPDDPWGRFRPRPLHRLDRAANGLIAFAKSAAVFGAVWRSGVERRYRARVSGRVERDAGTIDAPLGRDPDLDYRRAVVPADRGGQRAVTHWRVVERNSDDTLLEVTLETGRTHQIRAHLASIGHPIVGDTLYAGDARDSVSSIALAATELALVHPRTGERLVWTA